MTLPSVISSTTSQHASAMSSRLFERTEMAHGVFDERLVDELTEIDLLLYQALGRPVILVVSHGFDVDGGIGLEAGGNRLLVQGAVFDGGVLDEDGHDLVE